MTAMEIRFVVNSAGAGWKHILKVYVKYPRKMRELFNLYTVIV